MAARLDQAHIETIHDLEVQVAELAETKASLEVSLKMHGSELQREQEANAKLARERDYFKSFGVEIATRLVVLRDSIDGVLKAAELAGYKPNVVSDFKVPSDVADETLTSIATALGANGAKHEEIPA